MESYLQIEIDDSTHPSSNQVNVWMEEIETDLQRRNLESQATGSGTVLTVHPTEAMAKGTVAWFLRGLPENQRGRVVIPPFRPIISVNSGSFYRNSATLTGTPSWEILKCKDNLPDAADTDFLILKEENHKTGNYDGVAFYFYHDIPDAGRRRVSGGWWYGYNINSKILREYATLGVVKKVIWARVMTGQPVGLAAYRGPDLQEFVNTQARAMTEYIDARMEEIEDKHFPEELAIATAQGV